MPQQISTTVATVPLDSREFNIHAALNLIHPVSSKCPECPKCPKQRVWKVQSFFAMTAYRILLPIHAPLLSSQVSTTGPLYTFLAQTK